MEVKGQRTAVLLDPRPEAGKAVARVLESLGIQVLDIADSCGGALRLLRRSTPDLFVIDVPVDGEAADAIECVREAKSNHRELRAVLLSGRNDTELVDAALAAGASAYVVKSSHPDDIASAIRQVFETSVYIPPREHTRPAPPAAPTSARLTRRELEILQLVAEGKSNSDVAKELWVTEPTVKFHLSNIYRKLDVTNRTEAARRAQVHGLLDEGGQTAPGTG